jgi:hypothetical protein
VRVRPGLQDFFWVAGGAVLLIMVILLALHNYREEDIVAKAALKTRRMELVAQMRAGLSSASESEMSAVMATTDEESRTFAEQARAASARVEQGRDELAKLLETGGTKKERDLLTQFSQDLAECQHIDGELLDLAVKNTNLKAWALAFGPAADALAGMDGALSRILKDASTSTDPAAKQVMLLAAGAQSGTWRLQALLPPHISEESDQRMDELDTRIASEDQKVRLDLEGLAAFLGSRNPDLEAAMSGYARFAELRTQILILSHQNTNVRSVVISQNQKRMAIQFSQEGLDELEKAIQEEPLTDRLPVMPR